MVVHLNARPCLACFVRVILFLVPRASLYLYSSPESSRNATFSNKTRRFFLKAQESRNISKTASKEANTSLSHLDQALKQGEIGTKRRLKELKVEVHHSPMLTSCLSPTKTKSRNNKEGGETSSRTQTKDEQLINQANL